MIADCRVRQNSSTQERTRLADQNQDLNLFWFSALSSAAPNSDGRQGRPADLEQPETNDPLTLVREAYKHAQQTGFDTLLIDTAGRLHIDDELMVELERIKQETHPVEILFVADAMTGQDAVRSAEEFHKRVGITGVVLNKEDSMLGWRGPFHQTGYRSAGEVCRRRREIRRTRSFLSRPDRSAHSRDGRRPVVD